MAEPLRSSLCSTTSPGWGGFLAGKARAKGAPLVGSWPSLRGLRGFAALPRPRTYSFHKYYESAAAPLYNARQFAYNGTM